jgi:dethiobiotin synthetase
MLLFTTATDTGVGKTFVTCAIARALRAAGRDVGVMKPVATGCRRSDDGQLVSDDAGLLLAASGATDPMDLVTPVSFEPPLAPTAAARASGGAFDRDRILAAFGELKSHHEVLLVEGIGGLLVPLEGTYTVRDLAHDMAAPLVIVARNSLGAINHTALTVEAARSGGLDVRAVVLNRTPGLPSDASSDTNAAEIEALTGVPVAATLEPMDAGTSAAFRLEAQELVPLLRSSWV